MPSRRPPLAVRPRGCAAELLDVCVRFGASTVLRDVSLSLDGGSVYEVRGTNGSGKTTLLRVLAGTCLPSSGRREVGRPVAFVPALVEPPQLSVRGWLDAVRSRRADVFEALEVLGFRGDPDRSFRQLSYGNFRKVLLADALTAAADLVVADEAREGLDDPGIAGLEVLVTRRCAQGAAVVLADQLVHAPIRSAEVLRLVTGRVERGGAPSIGLVTRAYLGPEDQALALDAEAAKLRFQRTDDA